MLVFNYLNYVSCASVCLIHILFTCTSCWLIKYRGSVDPSVYALVFKCKSKVCTYLGGAYLYFVNHHCHAMLCIFIWQILVLSSNTKKGEIERAFPYLNGFVCLLSTQVRFNHVLKYCRLFIQIRTTVFDPSKSENSIYEDLDFRLCF